MAVSKKRKKNGKTVKFDKIKTFTKALNKTESIYDRITYFSQLYGLNKEPYEYALQNYLETLVYFKKRNTKNYEEYLHGETRIGLQQYNNKEVLIEGTLVNVKTDEDGYITKVCLLGPCLYGQIKDPNKLKTELNKINPSNRLKNTSHLNYLVDWLKNEYKISSHIWVPLDTKVKIPNLYLSTDIQFIAKVCSYKGKVKKEGYRTLKYGLSDGYFVSQSITTTTKDSTEQSKNHSKERRDGSHSYKVSNGNKVVRIECNGWHEDMAVGISEDNKLKLNEEVYLFFSETKSSSEASLKATQLITKYDTKYINQLKNKINLLKSISNLNMEVKDKEDENNSKTKMED